MGAVNKTFRSHLRQSALFMEHEARHLHALPPPCARFDSSNVRGVIKRCHSQPHATILFQRFAEQQVTLVLSQAHVEAIVFCYPAQVRLAVSLTLRKTPQRAQML